MLIKRLPVTELREMLRDLKAMQEVLPSYARRKKIGLITQELKERRPRGK